MSEFVMRVQLDNAAFEDSNELPRILRKVADKIERNQELGQVFDINGNSVGHAVINVEEDAAAKERGE